MSKFDLIATGDYTERNKRNRAEMLLNAVEPRRVKAIRAVVSGQISKKEGNPLDEEEDGEILDKLYDMDKEIMSAQLSKEKWNRTEKRLDETGEPVHCSIPDQEGGVDADNRWRCKIRYAN